MYIYIYIYIYKVSLLENIIYTIYITSRLLVIGFSNSRISRDLDFLTRILGSRTILICIGQINYLTENQTLYIDWPSLSICSVRKEQSPRRHYCTKLRESGWPKSGERRVSFDRSALRALALGRWLEELTELRATTGEQEGTICARPASDVWLRRCKSGESGTTHARRGSGHSGSRARAEAVSSVTCRRRVAAPFRHRPHRGREPRAESSLITTTMEQRRAWLYTVLYCTLSVVVVVALPVE